jgi:hypothetical protein
MINKSVLVLGLLGLLTVVGPASAAAIGVVSVPVPLIGVGAVALAATAGALIISRVFSKR